MRKTIKKTISVFFALVMTFSTMSLSGMAGIKWSDIIELFAVKANATNQVASDNIDNWIMSGAYYDENNEYYVLTKDSTWQTGAMWFNSPCYGDFSIEMDYFTGSKDGADGMAVAFYANYDYVKSNGEGLGFNGCKGYGVELDTYRNSKDPSYNHIALIKNTVTNHLKTVALNESEDNLWHHLSITVEDSLCSVYVDSNLKFTYEVSSTDYGWIGISAATGASRNLHAVKNISISGEFEGYSFLDFSLTSNLTSCVYENENTISGYNYEIVATIKNNSAVSVNNITTSLTLPKELLISDDSSTTCNFESIAIGEKKELKWKIYTNKPDENTVVKLNFLININNVAILNKNKDFCIVSDYSSYGIANFAVVNAQTLEPLKNATISIPRDNFEDLLLFTDDDGQCKTILPVGEHGVSVYASGCLTRNLKIRINVGENEIPVIGLSGQKTYSASLSSKEMTEDEIRDAGIDISAPENQHVFQYELKVEYVPEIDWFSLLYYMNGNGEVVGPGSGTSSDGKSITWIPKENSSSSVGGYFAVDDIVVYPVSEYMYLIIRGEVTWLKEMFDVEMLIVNNSETDTLENLTCTLELPDGLSLATMLDEQQSLAQTIDQIAEGESESVHWYIRGDVAGSYDLRAKLEGTIMPFEEEINEEFVTENAIQVWAGNALNIHFEFPNAAYYNYDYPVTITLTNVSDKTLYNVCHSINGITQSRIMYYSGEVLEKETYIDTGFVGRSFVDEFKPADKIVMLIPINIMFESELMEQQLERLIGFVDSVEKLINAYKAVKVGIEAIDAVVNCVSNCMKALAKFEVSDYGLPTDKLELARTLYNSISDLYGEYTSSGNDTVDGVSKLANSTLKMTLNALASNPIKFLTETAASDIKAIINDVNALANTISNEDQLAINKFNIFDSIRTAISAIPIRFAVNNVFFAGDQSNTTDIPWSYSITQAGPQYFGVSDVGRYYGNLLKAAMAEVYDECVPSYIQLIPGCDDPLNYDDIKREIIAVENEIAEFKAKDATGNVTFKAWVERNEAATFSASVADLVTQSNSDFDISCDNDSATFENGVLTFTGDGIISVTPFSTVDGTLIVEDSEGNRYEYSMTVVEQHDCIEGEKEIILHPSDEYDGVAVKRCTTCKDVLDVEILSVNECATHTFGDWIKECEATCSISGIKTRVCSTCGYCEVEYTDTTDHTPGEWENVEATETEAEKRIKICTVCGITVEEEYFNYIPVDSVLLNLDVVQLEHSQTVNLIATVLPNNSSNKKVVWSSSDSNVAIVDGNGIVTAVSSGLATITVMTNDGSFTASCEITVTPKSYYITWNVEGIESQHKITEGDVIVKPSTPVKEGYKFIGWTPAVPEAMPSYDLTFTAVFDKSYTCPDCGKEILGEDAINEHIASEIKVNITGGTVVSGVVAPGATITVSAPQTNGKIFSHWEVTGATIEDAESAETTIVLGSGKINITAVYDDCDCKCHQGGVAGFFFKIVLFFQKIFGNNLECFCGAKH